MEMKTSGTEVAIAVGKGLLGSIPFVGPLAAEVVGVLIPNQRLDRIQGFLMKLEEKVRELDDNRIRSRFSDPGFVDVFEDGMYQAARARSEERLEYIASLMKNSLNQEDAKSLQNKHLLSLLGELNDVEITLLRSHAKHPDRDQEFWERHEELLKPHSVHFGASREQLDAASIHESYTQHLVRLGLLQNTYRTTKQGEVPEFDSKTGTIKANGQQMTPLGRLLLHSIDLLEEGEY